MQDVSLTCLALVHRYLLCLPRRHCEWYFSIPRSSNQALLHLFMMAGAAPVPVLAEETGTLVLSVADIEKAGSSKLATDARGQIIAHTTD